MTDPSQAPVEPVQPPIDDATSKPSTDIAVDNAAVANIKLPPYWPQDPLVWFAQVEAQFTTRRITKEDSKYAYVVSSLSPDIAQEVRDLLIAKPAVQPYTTLKTALVARTSESEQRRLQQLLTEEELGDRKPTQLLRRMKQLLGDRALEDSILRQLFVQRMPTNVQQILASSSDSLTVTQLAELADRILAVTAPSFVNAMTAPPQTTPTSNQHLQDQIHRLTMQVETLTMQLRNRERSLSRGRSAIRRNRQHTSRSSSPAVPAQTPASDDNGECWYHQTYGEHARRCQPPCRRQPSSAHQRPAATSQGNEQASA
ncbi:uncharacterized protein [Diadema setosum]|uniref:uncharacterized protein n=1 Tax=Diadema setosum TaxID=31175 RepID=UPI003B3B0F1E